jgi:hypothetical protein
VKQHNSPKKLRELVVHLASGGQTVRTPSLSVLLYYCDFAAYRAVGQSITGSVYEHAADGPSLRDEASTWKHLQEDGAIALTTLSAERGEGDVVTARRPANLDVLSSAELDVVRSVVSQYLPLGAEELVAAVRREPGWRLTRDGEEIPYRTAWLSADGLTEEEIRSGREIAATHGLLERTAL